jgi:threonine aldolase
MNAPAFWADFRSDTVTRPTPGMLDAMQRASVGDDVLGDDPTVLRLEATLAEQFGMEAGLFCPSGTMTNQIAINVHTRPGDELICSPLAHVYNYEGGGVAFNSGVQIRVAGDAYGRVTPDQVRQALQPQDNIHAAPTRLVVMENTSNKGGGTCLGLPALQAVGDVARQNGLAYHLDGARLWNALVHDRESPQDYGKLFDSISLCLSKGLGTPVGSVLVGNRDFISHARRIRKRFGGGMRQAGYLAAAGLYALEHHVDRLAEDHRLASQLDSFLATVPGIEERKPVTTNIVIFRLSENLDARALQAHLAQKGIGISAMDAQWLRAVTHYDVGTKALEALQEGLQTFLV